MSDVDTPLESTDVPKKRGGYGSLLRGENNFDFPKIWRKALMLSAALVLISILAFFIRGFNLGIDFEGGTAFEVLAPDTSVAEARDFLGDYNAADAKIQIVGEDTIRIRSDIEDPEVADELRLALADLGQVTGFESVGPTWGEEITSKALRALLFFFVAIAVYISVRLEWRMAVGALVAVFHDLIVSVGIYALFQIEVTPATVIAFLTIMGYSLYDTIVVYDKVHEITARVGATGKYTYTEMMNLALNRVLMRSVNTTITSVIPVVSMLLVGAVILGAVTLQEFAIALLVGLIVGGYSSLFIASAVVAWLKEKEPRHTEVRNKLDAKGLLDGTRTVDHQDAVLGSTPRRQARPTKPGAAKSSGASAKADKPNKPTNKAKGDAEPSSDEAPAKKAIERPAPTGAIPPRPRKKKKR